MKKLKIFIIICLIICLIPIIINFSIIFSSSKKVYKEEDIKETYEIGLVLGCSVKNNKPSKMLRDRLEKAISLYENKIIKKILVSGDDRINYSEVTVMHDYLVENNVNDSDIIIDNIGFSTGESLENYAKNYQDTKVVIITQKYHLYRSLFIAKKLNIDAIGVYAKEESYPGDFYREAREILARNKDFLKYGIAKIWS